MENTYETEHGFEFTCGWSAHATGFKKGHQKMNMDIRAPVAGEANGRRGSVRETNYPIEIRIGLCLRIWLCDSFSKQSLRALQTTITKRIK